MALAGALALGGCDKKKEHAKGDGHGHAEKHADKAPEKDEHGHAHGGEEAEHSDEVKLTAEAVERYEIKTQPAQLWQLRPTFVAPGRIAFNTEAMAHVGSPMRGRAVEVKVKLGSLVKAGDALMVIESPDLGEAQSDFLMKQATALNSSPAVDLAKVAWDRAKGLYEKSQGIALTEVQKREAEYKVTQANLKAAQAAVVAAENKLHLLGMKQAQIDALTKTGEVNPRFTITAPIPGQVVERDVTLGELVNPDSDSLLIIADTTVLWVLVDIPEARINQTAVNAKAWVQVGGEEGTKLEGHIKFISPIVDEATRTIQARIELPGNDEKVALKPGMFTQIEVTATDPKAPEPTPVVAVSAEAIQTVEGAPAVFVPVANEPNTFAKRTITIGKPVGGLVPVYSGLAEGEQYIGSGTFLLKAELGKSSASHEH